MFQCVGLKVVSLFAKLGWFWFSSCQIVFGVFVMIFFFVQIKCKLGQFYIVVNAFVEVEIVFEIYFMVGQYDLLVKFYVDKDIDIGYFVNEKVQVLLGIQDILIIIIFKVFGVS